MQRIVVTLSPAEHAALNWLADAALRGPHDQLRYVLREAAQRAGVWPEEQQAADGRPGPIGDHRSEVNHERSAA
jgi:hypothetical protein